ncbi:hypothetical protein ACHAWO_013787 [Cyclotella atomus]|uniref:DDE Tnp4 domain-containing protein n=1 Tax=Cyclotella atomus TaxID=382360 RepID=A0ABD3PGW3_9STRA
MPINSSTRAVVNEYTMSFDAHKDLVEILRPYLQRKEYNSRSTEPIAVEHMVAAGLRHLQGGRVKDARHIVKTSRAWRAVNEGFRRRSFNDTMSGTVGALDGFFQRSNRPTMKETNNVVSYYSGHYESYGVNCLAAVKADLQFMYFGVISQDLPTTSVLCNGICSEASYESLPLGFNPYHDSFNFHLSQLRIRVEMAFGRMVNKFRILSGKVNGSLDRVSAILNACARLHNFIIQRDGPCDMMTVEMNANEEEMHLQIRPDIAAPLGMSYLPTIPDDSYVFEMEEGVSQTREEVVNFLSDNLLRRPVHNILRRRRELATAVG